MEFVRRSLARFAGPVGRFLYPPVCAGCGGALAEAPAVCAGCWRSLRFIERPYCEVLGLPFSYDLGRGFLSAEAIADPPVFKRLRAALVYEALAARMVASLKYADRADLVPLMAGWMRRAGREVIEECDVVVPVPLHSRRLLARKFNQSAELARALARAERIAYAPLCLRRLRATRSQVGLGPDERLRNVRGAFAVAAGREGEVVGRHVLLVDDVFTTGATVSAATRALKRAGAAEVSVLVFARVAAGAG
ncbi:ComF family protein [Aureimonas sp. SK2]|uniref:ComF family protein n=1 Tax=Aureimonas sp. SK2 TaxID=3015992 RepID=UPI002443E90A|nr:ComF family protein [Aureimonas sp. SK2]